MSIVSKKAPVLLFAGDFAVFVISLWIALFVRLAHIPSWELFLQHFVAFIPLFVAWILIFFIAGLYEKNAILLKNSVPAVLFNSQLINAGIAVVFFYFAPFLPIAPKTTLFIYVIISSVCLLIWRTAISPRFSKNDTKEKAVIIGSGAEMNELKKEINGGKYPLKFISSIDLDHSDNFDFQNDVVLKIYSEDVSVVVIDLQHKKADPIIPQLYNLIFSKVRFIDLHTVYEEVFGRVGLSLLSYQWFLTNISNTTSIIYTVGKRIIDLVGGLAMGLVTLIALPFIYIAMRLEGPGPLFITQERIGRSNSRLKTYKFRSMRFNRSASDTWIAEEQEKEKNYVTRVGNILRKTSLDEFPQFLNILRGEISLIGPRNDIEGLGQRLAQEIPYYNMRYVVKPGITGWAQINQQYEQGNISPQSIEETKMRLAYDFYYIKHRSFFLDLKIALQTIRTLISRTGK